MTVAELPPTSAISFDYKRKHSCIVPPFLRLWRFPQSIASGMGYPQTHTTTLRKLNVKVMISHDAQFINNKQTYTHTCMIICNQISKQHCKTGHSKWLACLWRRIPKGLESFGLAAGRNPEERLNHETTNDVLNKGHETK